MPNQVHVLAYSENSEEVGLRVVIGCNTFATHYYRKWGMVYVRNRHSFSGLGLSYLSKSP